MQYIWPVLQETHQERQKERGGEERGEVVMNQSRKT